MPNAVNYNVNAQTQALKKGNFWIATGDVGKGSGYWNGISPPLSGYTIYLNKASNGPSIYTVSTEAQLTGLTSTIAGQTLTTSGACLNWFATQTDKMILNKDYNNIVTNGLVLNMDASFTPSYPTTGTTIYDVSPSGTNGTLTNGPTFNFGNGGSILFDGVDDYIYYGNPSSLQFNNATFSYGGLFYWTNTNTHTLFLGKRDGSNSINVPTGSNYNQYNLAIAETMCCGPAGKRIGAYLACDGGSVQGGELITDLPNTEGWVYAIVTVNTTEQKLYLNGELKVTTTQNFTNKTFNIVGRSFYVGATGGENEGSIILPFNNKIASVQVYNRTLSGSEVLQNYLATINPKFIFGSNLKIWYDMSLQPSEASVDNVNTIDSSNNLVTLSRVYDLSGNGKHLLQTTKINQPTFIPNAQNGKPANYNTGGSVYDLDATVMRASYNALTSGARSFFIVLKGAPSSTFSWDRDTSNRGSLQLGYAGVNGWNDLTQDASVSIGGGNGTTTYVMSYLFDTTQTLLYRNGNLNRSQSNNTYTISTGGSSPFGCWTTAPSSGNQEGSWYEMVYLNKIPTIAEYNSLVTYLGTKWGVSCGTLTNYN
jgi:hypothetical protein